MLKAKKMRADVRPRKCWICRESAIALLSLLARSLAPHCRTLRFALHNSSRHQKRVETRKRVADRQSTHTPPSAAAEPLLWSHSHPRLRLSALNQAAIEADNAQCQCRLPHLE